MQRHSNLYVCIQSYITQPQKTNFSNQKLIKWRPDKTHHTVGTYIETTKNALETEPNNNKNKYYNNLTKALKELPDRDDIIITKADKGGAVVIIDVEDYIKEAEYQLNNKSA